METRGTILLVDDTPDIADLLRTTLAEAGYRVLIAPTVEIGVQILGAFRVGLVLVNASCSTHGEPGDPWSGLDRLVRAAGAAPLILNAPDEPHRHADYLAHGFAARLTNPLDLDALLTTVGVFLLDAGHHLAVPHGLATASKG